MYKIIMPLTFKTTFMFNKCFEQCYTEVTRSVNLLEHGLIKKEKKKKEAQRSSGGLLTS